ncbi:hypothetical protein SNE40_019354 [Patella caerulea]|uniref:EGF-like domain-containing protein n=1 Tax=Patella caerulea TaxID=87958 RepID=A0AAN8J6X0_PATCE
MLFTTVYDISYPIQIVDPWFSLSQQELGLKGEVVRERRSADSAAEQTGLVYDPNCDPNYKSISASHSMCLVDVGIAVPLSQAVKTAVLQAHNGHRTAVSPTATNMQKMAWDDELATIATKWAQQCRSGHDKGVARTAISLPNIYNGQNMAAGFDTFVDAVTAWHAEVVDYQYGQGSINGKAVGHYTQVVHHQSARVGCGQANCDGKQYYICNYAIGQGSIKNPYTTGASCSACPSKCSDKLCDCQGKLCYNYGTLDINTCTCTCPSIYTGDQCQTLSCNNIEKAWCATANASDCGTYSNYPTDCNMLCGVCPYPCNGKKCKNGGALNIDTCTCTCTSPYSGDTCTETSCTKLDKSFCANYPASACQQYSNFPSDCSIKCGICPPPCNGKTCQNGGTLNLPSCSCTCPSPYTGDTCTEKNCNGEEPWCTQVTLELCAKYSNLPSDCSITCGICPKREFLY